MTNIINTYDLCKQYAHKLVIDKVNMHIPEHAIYGFVGENGSGKTTIMRLITGLAEPTSGSFDLFGANNKDNAIYEARRKISAIVETTSLVPTFTALENLTFAAMYMGIEVSEEEKIALLKKVHLENTGKKKVKNFSLGMRQRLGIALALLNKPKLMLLDEPMNGLDPEGIAELRDLLIELNQKDGISVLISSHILSELEKIATHYGFISQGKLVEEISAKDLQDKCRKSLTLKVDDLSKAEQILKDNNYQNYKLSSNGEIRVFDYSNINDVTNLFIQNHIMMLSINSNDESVEDYYLNLIKEGK